MNNTLKVIIVLAVLALGGFGVIALRGSTNKSMEMPDSTQQLSGNDDQIVEINQVSYKDFAVSPKHIRVKKGTTVTWTNQDSAKHDVTPDNETDEFKASKLFGKGETYSLTFNSVGSFSYYCSPHPYMKGIVEVVE